MISTRYVIPVIILLALALIPTIIHSYIGATDHDGKSVQNIPFTLNNFTSTPAKRNAQWGEDMLGAPSYLMKHLGLLSPNIHSHTERIG